MLLLRVLILTWCEFLECVEYIRTSETKSSPSMHNDCMFMLRYFDKLLQISLYCLNNVHILLRMDSFLICVYSRQEEWLWWPETRGLHGWRGKDISISLQKHLVLLKICCLEDINHIQQDFGAHGIAPKVVSAQEQFAQAEGERKRPHTDSGVIPGVPPLENLIVPSKSTIGAQILKAMGWREGQGVGPKVLRHQPHQGGFWVNIGTVCMFFLPYMTRTHML